MTAQICTLSFFHKTAQAACSTVFLLMSKLRFDESLSFLLDPFRFTKMVGSSGLEPPTSRLSGVRSNHLSYEPSFGGDERVRTDDPLLAKQVLSQLSYTPVLSFRFRTSKIKQRIKDPQSVSALLTRSSAPSWHHFSLERR